MKVIHGLWTPLDTQAFIQTGRFSIWVESDETRRVSKETLHPHHLTEKPCLDFIKQELALTPTTDNTSGYRRLQLPTYKNEPLPSPELAVILPEDDESVSWSPWEVFCFDLAKPIKDINNIHFLACYQATNTRVASDFLFWYYFSQSLKNILYKDQFIPALLAHEVKKKREFYRYWHIVSPQYESLLHQAVSQIPLACSLGYEPESLLRHFAEVCISDILDYALSRLPGAFNDKVRGNLSLVLSSIQLNKPLALMTDVLAAKYCQWQHKLIGKAADAGLQLGFQLYEAEPSDPEQWQLAFFIGSQQDPSTKYALQDYWPPQSAQKALVKQQFGAHVEQQVLLQLALAAKIYPKLWDGMETSRPDSVCLSLDEAFEFLKESAWVLEDAGYKIVIPAWLTPKGRQRAKLRMRTAGKSPAKNTSATSYLSLDNLIDYQYELAMGEHSVSLEEWQQLVESKTPLVHFRGQWVELDRDKMREMLLLWQQQQQDNSRLSVQQLLQKVAEEGDTFEVDLEDSLAAMLAKLSDSSQLQPIDNPEQLKANLRDYQKRGVAWLRYLESLQLNGCLADDMGLGKTMQVISLLVMEKAELQAGPTLLVAPTSVVGNWQKEVEKFAPHLTTLIHHGSEREKDAKAFNALCQDYDIVISSYNLVRKDAALFKSFAWRRLVLDEAQMIKNPAAAQTKAINSLNATHRLALTGTPVENRLQDLWSIFNFLNPGYLGKQAQFRKIYELPIQRDNNVKQSTILKKLTQPFVLRRLKTDKTIIKDLPDKIENKQYCNLSKEQAALYEAVVRDVEQKLEEEEGIARQGLMLSTLMKLKQICNHPMQYLQDGSAFTPERSHKLERLVDMLAEALEAGDSVLVFSQFTEIGDYLSRYLNREKHYPTYYLHGGTQRNKREQMISDFQSESTPPSVFVLSLKAGGVGITLTRASHVFHFDRWWNPAVENQATDRAFRIGQQKNVFVHKFVTLGTLEERIDQMIEDKQRMADTIIGNDESWLTKLDNQAFKALIALNKQSVMEN